MFILYNGTNVHAFPYLTYKTKRVRSKKTGKLKLVQKLDTNQSPQDIQWLRPGWNEFPKRVWDQNKEHPQVQRMILKKIIEILDDKFLVLRQGKKMKMAVGLEDVAIKLKWFDQKRAIEIVKKTFNRDILTRWLDEENRSAVKRSLSKQIEPLLNTEKEEDDEDQENDLDEVS